MLQRNLLFALTFSALAVNAQMSIAGKVSDITGAAISQAEVRAQLEGTEEPRYVARTNNTGHFELLGLQAGSYKMTVMVAGFRVEVIHGIRVSLENPRREFDRIVLQVGSMCSRGCDDFESPDSGIVRIPRRCAFLMDTREVTCNLEIGEREPVEPPSNARSYLWFSSNPDGSLYLTPRNGALIAMNQRCEDAHYTDTPIRLDELTPGDRGCAKSPGGNFAELFFGQTVSRDAVMVKPVSIPSK